MSDGEQVRPQHLICLVRPKLTVGCAARSPGRRSVNRQPARLIAVSRSWQPTTGFHRSDDGWPPKPSGLNRNTGPRRAAVCSITSSFVLVAITESGKSLITP
jgi:hypothetical protein